MSVHYGPNTAKGKDLYYGNVKIKEAYYGSTKVYNSSKQFTYNGTFHAFGSAGITEVNLSETIPAGTKVKVIATATGSLDFLSGYFYDGSSTVSEGVNGNPYIEHEYTLAKDATQFVMIYFYSYDASATYTVTITY